MILRRVIDHVKAQNWTAVALDFFIVVMGVFIGLQVQEWAVSRRDAAQEARYYERLHADFTAIAERIEGHFDTFNQVIDGADYILEIVRLGEAEFRAAEIDRPRLEAGLANLTEMRIPPGRSATYVEMLSASALSKIGNEKLRDRLAEYDRLSDIHREVYRSAADLNTISVPVVYRHYKVATALDETVVSGMKSSVLEYDIDAMRSDPEFETAVMILGINTRNNYGVRLKEKRLADEILALLEAEQRR